VQLGFLAVVGVVAAPIGAGAVAVASGSAIASVAVVPLAPAYGVLVWVVGRRVASDWLATKGPELLAAVSPARAG
jgi:type IV secretory pathway TrbD component